jgi:hypothetical protein
MSFTCIIRLPDGRDAVYHTEGLAAGDDPVVKIMQRIHRKIVCNDDPIPGDLQKVTDWWNAHEPVHETPVPQV